MDEKLKEIDQRIEGLKNLRAEREKELADPERQEVYRAYEELDRILDRLVDLGENVETPEGHDIDIAGRLFRYSYGSGIRENKNPERKRGKR